MPAVLSELTPGWWGTGQWAGGLLSASSSLEKRIQTFICPRMSHASHDLSPTGLRLSAKKT